MDNQIAVIGMGCRFPKAKGLREYWNLLENGVNGISTLSKERESLINLEKKDNSEIFGGFLEDIDKFDPHFFQISQREAACMDPQQRILLEVSWEALENANIAPSHLKGSQTGVYVGASAMDYLHYQIQSSKKEPYMVSGGALSVLANRISYFYDFHGPSMCIDTACSSSLVAVYQASQDLLKNECDIAIAAGVNIMLSNNITSGLNSAKMLSLDGKCKTFDDSANGYVRGEGCGVLVLKRLEEAVKDKDNIKAIIRGGAINQDGRSNGLNAPNGIAQRKVIQKALKSAGVKFNDVTYIEAHGTGTALGDPIEVKALDDIYGMKNSNSHKLLVGSVKTNIGHLEAAAGIAGIIKVILALQHNKIPPNLNFKKMNGYINLSNSRLSIPTNLEEWNRNVKKIAAVSSFGFGGTNGHIILQEAPLRLGNIKQKYKGSNILALSAQTNDGLLRLVNEYRNYLELNTNDIEEICAVANNFREKFEKRIAFIPHSLTDLKNQISNYIKGTSQKGIIKPKNHNEESKIVFMFSGQGSQYINMAKDLYFTSDVFRKNMNICDDLLKGKVNKSIISIIYSEEDKDSELLKQTDNAQCALFAIEYSLAKLWISIGISPNAVIGHSIGEYVAACIAGAISLEDALHLVAVRGKLMSEICSNGQMAVILADELTVINTIKNEGSVEIAAVNGKANVVISGKEEELIRVTNIFKKSGIGCVFLNVNKAFHSYLMEPMINRYFELLEKIEFKTPKIPLITNLTGQLQVERLNANYWIRHTREPVRFYDGLKTLIEQGYNMFLEVGPDSILSNMGKREFLQEECIWISSLKKGANDLDTFFTAVGHFFVQGKNINWDKLYSKENYNLVDIPNYQFDKKSCWVDLSKFKEVEMVNKEGNSFKNEVINVIQDIFAELLLVQRDSIDINTPLLEIGADSLILMELVQKIQKKYNLTYSIRMFFEEIQTINELAISITKRLSSNSRSMNIDLVENREESEQNYKNEIIKDEEFDYYKEYIPNNLEETTGFETIVLEQLGVLERTIKEQLRVISTKVHPKNNNNKEFLPEHAEERVYLEKKNLEINEGYFGRDRVPRTLNKSISPIVNRLSEKTLGSKSWITKYRPYFADYRGANRFRFSTKEAHYLPVVKRACGSKFWDIDDNEYIDLTMGFGVNLFGHAPDFINNAISEELKNGYALGPQSNLAGQVAEKICKLTNMERLTFCNTGTEAVMAGLRMARAVTGKNKIAIFSGSYHGTFDGVLAGMSNKSGSNGSTPLAPGIPKGIANDVIVLDYDDPESLNIIEKHANDLAAVLVEPVQSRRPELQPISFLKKLKHLTTRYNIALVFDEVITGFRVHQGGVQALFEVKADIAIYGKVIGGGMHIGIVAGSSRFLDSVDGGQWAFGDESYPNKDTTLIAGTFCKHPLTMASTNAVVEKILNEGPALQSELNKRTELLANELNDYFMNVNVPIEVVYFGSLFRFNHSINVDMFFYGLIEKGIYVWEGRNCFLSTAHSNEDITKIISAIKEVTEELIVSGYFPNYNTENLKSLGNTYKKTSFPLTEDQKELYYLSEMGSSASQACNETVVLELEGKLDVEILTSVIQQVVNRHDSLRLSINTKSLTQEINQNRDAQINFEDFSDLEEINKVKKINKWIAQDTRKVFDLANDTLFRCTILKESDNKHLLVFTAHHLIVDGFSIAVILEEMLKIYSSLYDHTPVNISPPLSLEKYFEWKQKKENSPEREKNLVFWKENLGDSKLKVDLPTDFPKLKEKNYSGAVERVIIDKKLSEDLNSFSRHNNVTPYMIFFGAFSAFIKRISQQDSFVIGTPFAQRSLENGQAFIGYAINLLPIKIEFTEDIDFLSFISYIKEKLLIAQEHSNYSFNELFRNKDFQDERGIIDVVFNYEKKVRLPENRNFSIDLYQVPIFSSKYDLSLNVCEFNGDVIIEAIYDTNLFKGSTIKSWLEGLVTLLKSISQNYDNKISCLPIIEDKEHYNIIKKFNETDRDYPLDKCIDALVEEQVEKSPNTIAILYGEEKVTYKELNERANQLANYLRKQGVGPDKLVGICIERSIEMVVGMLAILKAGGAYVPIDPKLPEDRIKFILDDTRATILLTSTGLSDMFLHSNSLIVGLDTVMDQISIESKSNLKNEKSSRNLAYVIYTSGSTGYPKGVLIEHRGINNLLHYRQEKYQIGMSDKLLQTYNFSFDAAVWTFWWPLMAGATLVVGNSMDYQNIERLVEIIKEKEITVVGLVPAQLKYFVNNDNVRHINSLKYIICGGEPLPTILADNLLKKLPGVTLINAYGPTECSIDTTDFICKGLEYEGTNQPIGNPIANMKTYILDENLNPVPFGVPGELYIGGVGLARGYLNRKSLNTKRFIKNPYAEHTSNDRLYKTGDLARYLTNGEIEYLGRLDQQVKINGYRIELEEIENVLKRNPAIRDAIVIAKESDQDSTHLIAYLIINEGYEKPTVIQLKDYLKRILPNYMVPLAYVFMDSLPLLPNGKLDRLSLPQTNSSHYEVEKEVVTPKTNTEIVIVGIVEDILDIEGVGITEDFFEIGGNSLLAAQVTSQIFDIFSIELPLRVIFEARTAERICKALYEKRAGEQIDNISKIVIETAQQSELSI